MIKLAINITYSTFHNKVGNKATRLLQFWSNLVNGFMRNYFFSIFSRPYDE